MNLVQGEEEGGKVGQAIRSSWRVTLPTSAPSTLVFSVICFFSLAFSTDSNNWLHSLP